MLHIIGLGLENGEVTQKGLEALEEADKAFAEFYTNTETVDLEELEELTATDIEKLDREQVEREDRILEESEKHDVAFLVSGDPLTATTHYDIKHRAEEKDIDTRVHHAPSIFTSIAETGLNVYKFGRTVTLPMESKPSSLIEHIGKNDSIGLHTLILLDIDYPADEAAQKLVEMEEELSGRETVVLERANQDSQQVSVMNLEEVAETEFGEPPHCLILTGEKSHMEQDFIEAHDG